MTNSMQNIGLLKKKQSEIQQKTAAMSEENQRLIESVSQDFRQRLTALQEAAENDIEALIEQNKELLIATAKTQAKTYRQELNKEQMRLNQAVKTETKRLIWALKIPVLLLVIATIWAVILGYILTPYGLWSEPTKTAVMTDGRSYLMLTGSDWTQCRDGQNLVPCKPK